MDMLGLQMRWVSSSECQDEVNWSILGVDHSDDSLVMLDFKTSNGVFNSHALQVVAYAKAYEEMTGETVDK